MAPSSLSISLSSLPISSPGCSFLSPSLVLSLYVSLTLPGSLSVYCCCDTHLHTLPPTPALFGSLGLRGQNVTGSTCALIRPSTFYFPHLYFLIHPFLYKYLVTMSCVIFWVPSHIFICFYHQTAKLPGVFLVSLNPQPFGLDQPSREASAPCGPG